MNKKKQQTEQNQEEDRRCGKSFICSKGYKATAIEDIVKAVGCSAGNIYYHFKNKEGLFLYLLEEWNREWDSNWLVKEKLYATTTDKLYGMVEYLALDQLNHPLTRAADEFLITRRKPQMWRSE